MVRPRLPRLGSWEDPHSIHSARGLYPLIDLLGSVGESARHLQGVVSPSILWSGSVNASILAIAIVLYFSIRRSGWQNLTLLALGMNLVWHVSRLYFVILFASAVAEWLIAKRLFRESSDKIRRRLFWTSAGMNFAIMCLFLLPIEYLILRAMPTWTAGTVVGKGAGWLVASFVGSSFFLFSKMTLSTDAYHRRLKESPRFLDSMVFVSLFTRSWGTPMDRARDTLPQLASVRVWNWSKAEDSLWWILQGIFKFALTMGIGDSPSRLVSLDSTSWVGYLLGSWAVALRFWLSFSATIDVSRGLGAAFGLDIPKNFDVPFFSTNISDFWRRWNMSFGNWLYEEVFAKLNFRFRNWGNAGLAIACLGTFGISALAHGMDWGTVLWLCIQGGLVFLYFVLRPKIRRWSKDRNNPRWFAFLGWFSTIHLFVLLLTLTSYTTVAEIENALVSIARAPLWKTVPQVDQGRLAAFCVILLAFHYLPRLFPYETFRSRVPGWGRICLIPAAVSAILAMSSFA